MLWGDSYCSWIPFATAAHSPSILVRGGSQICRGKETSWPGCLMWLPIFGVTWPPSSSGGGRESPAQRGRRFFLCPADFQRVLISSHCLCCLACLESWTGLLSDPGQEGADLGCLPRLDGRSDVRDPVGFFSWVEG